MLLLDGHGRAEHDCEHRQPHRRILRPCAVEKIRAECVIDDAYDGERAGLDNGHGVQQRRHGRGRDRHGGQPRVNREQRRLDAEAHERHHKHRQQQILLVGDARHIQHAAVYELGRGVRAVGQHEYHADEGQRRAADRIVQIGAAGVDRRCVQLVEHKRQRDQRQQLVKRIEREQIAAQRDAGRYAIAHQIVGEECVLAPLRLHVFEGVERRQRPEEGD